MFSSVGSTFFRCKTSSRCHCLHLSDPLDELIFRDGKYDGTAQIITKKGSEVKNPFHNMKFEQVFYGCLGIVYEFFSRLFNNVVKRCALRLNEDSSHFCPFFAFFLFFNFPT